MAEIEAQPRSQDSKNLLAQAYTGVVEETFFQSGVVSKSIYTPWNPDDLYQKTGDYSIYEEMLQDDQVSVCLQLKKDLVIGAGFDIQPGDEGQEEVVEFLKEALVDNPSSTLDDDIEEILSAYEFGFSLTEKVFEVGGDGMLRLKKLYTRDPNSWLIHTDTKGLVEKIQQRSTPEGDKTIEPKSLIHFVNKPKFQNHYGQSDLRAAYAAWFAKRQCFKYLAIFMEKAASPIPVGRYEKTAPQSAVDKLFQILKKFQTKTAITIPKDVEVEFLEAKSDGEVFHKAINLFNMFIGRALFIPDLVGFQGSETGGGSYSLGKDQIKLFFQHIQRRKAQVEKALNRHLIIPICLYNFGDLKKFPKIVLKPVDDERAFELAKLWLEAVKGNTFKANDEEVNYFRSLVKFPEGDVEHNQPMPQLIDDKSNPVNDELQDTDDDDKPRKAGDDPKEGVAKFAKLSDLPGDYKKKVDFKAIKTKLDFYQNSIMAETQPVIKKIFRDLQDQIEKKKILQNQNAERIDTLSLKYLKELKQIIKGNLFDLYKESQIQAAKELDKREFASPIPADKFLEVLEAETFQYVGDWSYMITKKARVELLKAMKDGLPLSTVFEALDIDGNALSETSLERFSRTKITEVMNRGRKDYFDEGDIVQGYQYSAILDDRTSQICETLNGKIFTKESAPTPPMHWNCRSVLIPITKYEKMTPTASIGGKDPSAWLKEKSEETGFAVKA